MLWRIPTLARRLGEAFSLVSSSFEGFCSKYQLNQIAVFVNNPRAKVCSRPTIQLYYLKGDVTEYNTTSTQIKQATDLRDYESREEKLFPCY